MLMTARGRVTRLLESTENSRDVRRSQLSSLPKSSVSRLGCLPHRRVPGQISAFRYTFIDKLHIQCNWDPLAGARIPRGKS